MSSRRSCDFGLNFVISDLHSIFVDERAFNVFLGVLSESNAERVWINGDMMDFTCISAHIPKIKALKGGAFADRFLSQCDVETEVAFVKEHILAKLRKAAGKKTRIIYRTFANHEARYLYPPRNSDGLGMIREVEQKLGARTGSLHDLLNLGKFNIEIDPREQTLWNGTLLLVHGERSTTMAPKGNFGDYKVSGISSHTHRMGVFEERARGTGEKFIWVESGHLRTQDNVEYLSKPPNWCQGYLAVYMRKDGAFEIQRHQIHKHRSIFNGQVFTA